MPKEYTKEALIDVWMHFFLETGYKPAILELAGSYPDARSLEIPYAVIALYDYELANYLLDRPYEAISSARSAMRQLLPQALDAPLHFRPVQLPKDVPDVSMPIRSIRKEQVGRMIALEGLVKKTSEVRPRVLIGVFYCVRCTASIEEPQTDIEKLREPLECYESQGGCKRAAGSTLFKLITGYRSFDEPFQEPQEGKTLRFSLLEDVQRLEIQENPEGLRGGQNPERMHVILSDDLVGQVKAGERITVNGTLRERVKRDGKLRTPDLLLWIEAVSVERQKIDYEEIPISAEDEKEILALVAAPGLFEKLIASITPSIFGMEFEKEVLLLQLFGGVAKELPDGTHVRGDMHVLLCGDPGMAKSQLLRYIAQLAPRAIYTSGKTSSAAGLTAAAVRDDFLGGQWALEAGALVLADKGMACVDELDKMTTEDREALHEAMEQQTISVAKAGITAQLHCRTSLLAAANPQFGRFDPHSYLAEQINIPPTLLSRFDVILLVIDVVNAELDTVVSDHILDLHAYGSAADYTGESAFKAPVEVEFMRKYIAYAKNTIRPVLSDTAKVLLRDYYVNIRRQAAGDDKAVPLTNRQLESMIRGAEASARIRLSSIVETEDVERIIRIAGDWLRKVAGEAGGGLDIDIIAAGTSRAQREAARMLLEIIRQIDSGTGATEDDIISRATSEGIDEGRARRMLSRLAEQGQIYAPDRKHYKIATR